MNMFGIKKIAGIVMCIAAGAMAIKDEYENQQKEKKIEDMERRLAELERRETES